MFLQQLVFLLPRKVRKESIFVCQLNRKNNHSNQSKSWILLDVLTSSVLIGFGAADILTTNCKSSGTEENFFDDKPMTAPQPLFVPSLCCSLFLKEFASSYLPVFRLLTFTEHA